MYRFLTAGTVEIEMMEKQISKKKLDRMTMHGGDFRQAGKRAGSQLTLPYLRRLLEDDVQNLDRMRMTGGGGSVASDCGRSCGSEESSAALLGESDIPQSELDMLMDRERLFATVSQNAADVSEEAEEEAGGGGGGGDGLTPIPTEGTMYDIVAPQQSSLQAVA